MQRCERCDIAIRGQKRCCPLCGGKLTGKGGNDVYPALQKTSMSRLSVLKIVTFGTVVFEVAMLLLCFLLGRIPAGIALAMAAAGIALADVALTLYYRNNILRLLAWEFYIAMGLSLLVDAFTGFHRWSVIWVIPFLFIALMVVTTTVGKATHKSFSEYIRYLLFHTFLSTLLQIVFLLLHWNTVKLPSILSLAFVLLFFFGIAFFHGREFRREMQKTFNI